MSKKIYILEDHPERLEEYVKKIKKNPLVKSVEVLYYVSDWEKKKNIEDLEKVLDTEVEIVSILDFQEMLDELYAEPNSLFVFDTQLLERDDQVFEYRINVSYALRKREENSNFRIWFYTVAGANYLRLIEDYFKDHALTAAGMKDSKLLDLGLDQSDTFQAALNA